MNGLVIVGLLVILALVAPCFGVDTRDGRDWSARPGVPWSGRSPSWIVVAGPPSAGALLARLWAQQARAHEAVRRAQRPWLAEPPSRGEHELRWRRGLRGWRLTGRVLPTVPPTGAPHSDH